MRPLQLLYLCFLLLAGCMQGKQKPKLALLSTHVSFSPGEFEQAVKKYANSFTVTVYDPANFTAAEVAKADLVMCESLGARISIVQPQLDSIKQRTKIIYIGTPGATGNVDTFYATMLKTYWDNANTENYEGMLSYVGNKIFGLSLPIQKCITYPQYGFYHTGQDTLFTDLAAYLNWYAQYKAHTYNPDSLTVGLVYYQSAFVKKDLKVIDALIRNIESKGQNVIPLLAKGNFRIDSFFMKNNMPKVDVIIYGGMFLDFANPDRGRMSAKKLDVPILIGATSSNRTVQEWEEGIGGFSPDMTDRFFFTERDGAFEPLMIGAQVKDGEGRNWIEPISYQINWRVNRALSWARLRKKKNAEKKIVITYYSEGSGKANVGGDIDAYLNVQGSAVQLLKAFRQSGYNTGQKNIPTEKELSELMSAHASNVGSWAGAELARRKADTLHKVIRIPVDQYLQWFQHYPKALQDEVIAKWGAPPGNMMTVEDSTGRKEFVIPIIQYGNIVLAPHPNWGLQESNDMIYGTKAIPPHHAYIAFYEWMKHAYNADAFLSLFTQLSLMPGKQEGPSANDFVGLLIGDLPHITVTPLMSGSAVKNKRRASALTIGYMNELTEAVLSDSLQRIKRMIDDRRSATNPQIKNSLTEKIINLAAQQLKDKVEVSADPEIYISKIEKQLQAIISTKIPDGTHTLGVAPTGVKLQRLVKAMLGTQTAATDAAKQQLLQKEKMYVANLNRAGDEVKNILHAMNGGYVEAGPSDDVVRNPESLPPGRNPYSINDKNIPSKEAWEIGKRMADGLLVDYEQKHGKGSYPKKVAFVLWSTEITNSQGVTEAEIMYLMGVKPVWNTKGQVMGAELIPASVLQRPRIDVLITTSGTYRDHFADKVALLDTAVKLAGAVADTNNWVRNHALKYQQALKLKHAEQALPRIYSTAAGAYSTNLEFATEKGDSWSNDTTLSDLYMRRMANTLGHSDTAYQSALFALNIKDVDAAAFGRSSNVLGIMDHPMVAAYYGAINLAVKNSTGRTPDMYINDLADKNNSAVTTLQAFYHKEMDTRYLNPAWIKGMQAQGYDGARFMDAFAENLMLWDVTKSDMVTDEDWNKVYETYVEDKMKLGLHEFFEQNNPYAKQSFVSHLLEAAEKGYWHASDRQLQTLATTLSNSVVSHGATCNTAVCNSVKTKNFIKQVLEKVPGGNVLAAKYEATISNLKTSPTTASAKTGEKVQVQGYEVKETTVAQNKNSVTYVALILLIVVLLSGFVVEIRR
ncbi:MAG: cobaltochelatase subunit CobN [Filimonas sp.]|nr:cobaltochelatase subunit CobN [Filimonas sp.]